MCNCSDPENVNSDRVYYSGSTLTTLNILPNTNLTEILNIIDTFLSTFTGGTNYTIKGGTNTQTATGVLVYTIPHTLGAIPTTYTVMAKSAFADGDFSVTSDINNLYINYGVSPPTGSALEWVWSVTKL